MSRRTIALLLAVSPLPASAAQPLTSEQALENYRARIIDPRHCPDSSDPDDIVVCGRRSADNAYRLPLPVQPLPGQRVRGEPVSAVAAAGTREQCSTVGPNHECSGGIPILGIAVFIAKVVEKGIINPDD